MDAEEGAQVLFSPLSPWDCNANLLARLRRKFERMKDIVGVTDPPVLLGVSNDACCKKVNSIARSDSDFLQKGH
jgi:hypothetical protein